MFSLDENYCETFFFSIYIISSTLDYYDFLLASSTLSLKKKEIITYCLPYIPTAHVCYSILESYVYF